MRRIRPARVWTDARLLAWSALTLLLSPLILLAKLKRHFVQDYEWEFDPRRWRMAPLSPAAPPAEIVFVGAGPGELTMIDRLVAELQARRPELRVGVCLRALDVLPRLVQERPAQRLSLWPFDALPPVARWLQAERPEVLVFVDRFRFPVFAGGAAAAGTRLALVNGRSRRRRSLGHRLAAPFYRWQFSGFDLMAMQSEANAEAAREFARPDARIVAPGTLKADLRPGKLPEAQEASLRAWLLPDALPLVAVGSTTDIEEESFALDAFLAVREGTPCRLLLAPRDARRVPDTLALLGEKGLPVSRRSESGPPADVLLLDTFGELATAYAFVRAAYVGGFRGRGGGHNVLEPLEHAVPVAYGPNPGHFGAERGLIEPSGAGRSVADAAALAAFWRLFLTDDAERTRTGALGRRVVEENRGAVARTVDALLDLLAATASAPEAPAPRTSGPVP